MSVLQHSEGKLSDEQPSIPHLVEPSERPREPSLAARIDQVRKFKPAGILIGLCPSCLGSGFVHVVRDGVLGVLYRKTGEDKYGTDTGPLVRCDCPLGEKKAKKDSMRATRV